MFALRPSRHALCRALVLVSICTVPLFAQATVAGDKQRLYLLAATPMDIGSRYGYPATLYYADRGRLKIAREVISGTEGVSSVRASANAIFLTHPLYGSSERSVNIIHTREPLKDDDVTFNSDLQLGQMLVLLAEPRPSVVHELLPISKDFSEPLDTALVSVSSDESAPDSRVTYDMWNEYANLRREGDPGGPAGGQNFVGAAIGENLVFPPAFGHPVVIDSLPASVRAAAAATDLDRFLIIAANQRYMLLRLAYSFKEMTSGKMGSPMEVFIHDRARDQWKTIQIDGNTSRSRLFGSWLATVVGMFTFEHKPSPGIKNERSFETERLPSVRDLYGFAQSSNWLPGVLILQNLEDGRNIRIETDQQDSEILNVKGDSVFYRINDTIYQARIVGNQLRHAAAIVKDDDVPEVHWVFWSQ